MFLKAIRLGKNHSGQQLRKECIRCSTIFEVRDGLATPGNRFICMHLIIKRKSNLKNVPLPLISDSGKLYETHIKARCKKPLVTDLRSARKHVQVRVEYTFRVRA